MYMSARRAKKMVGGQFKRSAETSNVSFRKSNEWMTGEM